MKIKKYIYYTCLFWYCFSYSQKASGFVGCGIYLYKSSFVSFNAGIEYKINDNLKPEVEFSYFIGALPDKIKENINYFETERLERIMSATNISICPKIIFGNKEDKGRFQILPKYNFTKVFAEGKLFTYDDAKAAYINTDSDKTSEIRQSFGIGIGLILDISKKISQSIAFNLYYNNIDIGNAVNNLKFGEANYHTNQSLGLGIIYYFGLYNPAKITNNN